MENGKTSLNIRKLKKQVKGITLIALVVSRYYNCTFDISRNSFKSNNRTKWNI